jgi:peptidoglycan/xylan/chitin deacetylase (PgdA/CDA1 family)
LAEWRQAAKELAERVTVQSRLPRWVRARNPGRTAILAYHNVVPDGSRPVGDRSLHLPLERFREHLDWLAEHVDVVGLDALDAPAPSPRPRAAVTFDDAYRGAVTLGVPEVAARGLPCTVFVCPGRLDGDTFWWDRLAGPEGLAEELRHRVLQELEGRDERVARELDGAPSDLPDEYRTAGLDELLATPGQASFASHTWSHPNLTRLSAEAMDDELRRPRTWLVETFRERALADHLSFPYGLWNEAVARAAASAGYRWLYRVEGGLLHQQPDTEAALTPRPRINVPAGMSLEGFELRVSGLLG